MTQTTITKPAGDNDGDPEVDRWYVPPENQGQTVEVAYVIDDDGEPWMRTTDRGDQTVTYAPGEWGDPQQWEPWNEAPTCADFG